MDPKRPHSASRSNGVGSSLLPSHSYRIGCRSHWPRFETHGRASLGKRGHLERSKSGVWNVISVPRKKNMTRRICLRNRVRVYGGEDGGTMLDHPERKQ